MKKLPIFVFFICSLQTSHGQLFSKERVTNGIGYIDNKFFSWGYFLGFNSYDFKFNYNRNLDDILVENNIGFHLGLIGDMRVNDYINLRLEPGVFFSTRTLRYNSSYFLGIPFDDNDLKRDVKSTYLHVPLLVKLSTKRINNIKPFIVGGVSIATNMGSNEKNPEDNSAGQFRMTRQDFFYEIGFGIDIYTPYFKFSPSIRGVFAINNELIRDKDPNSPWTANIKSIKSRAVFINFTFQ